MKKSDDASAPLERGPWNRPLERLRGMDDLLPPSTRQMRRAIARLSDMAEAHGYQPVDLPLLEPTELFLRKSGEAWAPRLYAFTFRNREMCVRPEFTASVARLYVDHLQDAPLPQRLYYYGPVLRHEKPQRGRRRQFTQLGLELIGAGGALADAEMILAACRGLDALGVADYRLVLGHIGATQELFEAFQLDRRARAFLLANLENLSRPERGLAYVEERLMEQYPPARTPMPHSEVGAAKVSPELLLSILERIEAQAALGGRTPEEIAAGLLERMERPDPVPLIRQALQLADTLRQLSGVPGQALPAAADLLRTHGASVTPLRDVEAVVELLVQAGLPEERITVNLGFGRGLHYYTGVIFDLYAGEEAQQVCGGGRYDDLISSMGGRKAVPACGFAYGIERLVSCLPATEADRGLDLLLAVENASQDGVALRVADRLRTGGLRVDLDVRQRGGRAAAQAAGRAGIRWLLRLGAGEAGSVFRLTDRQNEREQQLTEAELYQWAATGFSAMPDAARRQEK